MTQKITPRRRMEEKKEIAFLKKNKLMSESDNLKSLL